MRHGPLEDSVGERLVRDGLPQLDVIGEVLDDLAANDSCGERRCEETRPLRRAAVGAVGAAVSRAPLPPSIGKRRVYELIAIVCEGS